MKRFAFLGGILGFAVAILISLNSDGQTAVAAGSYLAPPANSSTVTVQWDWIISSTVNPSSIPATVNLVDSDYFEDANSLNASEEASGPSSIVTQLHAGNRYSVCYVEAGAYQKGFPDDAHFAAADYGSGASQYQMQGYSDEYWFDIRGFAGYKPGGTLTGVAANIAAGLDQRFAGCKAEGQDAVEPDDLDGYTNKSNSGAAGGGWGLTQADAAGFEQWLAYDIHANGLAAFQKNDGANTAVDEPVFDGMIIEECNHYNDPCNGQSGDYVDDYISHGKPVLNAEYTQDGESISKFCAADESAGITGALFSVNLDGSSYATCQTGKGYVYQGSASSTSTSSTGTSSTTTSPSSTSSTTSTQTTSSSTSTVSSSSSTSSTQTTTTTSTSSSFPSRPSNTKKPSLSGTAKQGDQLKTTTGSWTGSPRFSYAWMRCRASCTVVKNATRQTYNLGSNDVGYQLQAIVTATNKVGSSSATTNLSATVATKAKAHANRRVKADRKMKQ